MQNLLPSGSPVAYSQQHKTNDLGAAISEAEAEYFKAAAPPPEILAKALYVIKVKGSFLFGQPPSVMYVLKKQSIFGFEICTGWYVEQVNGQGKPTGGYTVGPCNGERFTPSGGLPAIPSPRPG
ncbi:MAG TPA: hypothetical protein VKG44_08800 [Candidatus Baltobacteraceae bacterium]|nr:hypothetical protein [Candidatus Baltobacteraceae bacterium]